MFKPSILVHTATALLFSATAFPVLTFAQNQTYNEWDGNVRQKLEAVTTVLNLGYDARSSYEPFRGMLRNNTYTDVTHTLRGGIPYALIGVCDDDCSDLDLTLYDRNYNLIDSDTAPDNTPVIRVKPMWTDVFHVRVTMSRCTRSPCWYGIGEFEPH